MQSVQNLGLAIATIIAGIIVDNPGYLWLEVYFIGNLCSKFTVIYFSIYYMYIIVILQLL